MSHFVVQWVGTKDVKFSAVSQDQLVDGTIRNKGKKLIEKEVEVEWEGAIFWAKILYCVETSDEAEFIADDLADKELQKLKNLNLDQCELPPKRLPKKNKKYIQDTVTPPPKKPSKRKKKETTEDRLQSISSVLKDAFAAPPEVTQSDTTFSLPIVNVQNILPQNDVQNSQLRQAPPTPTSTSTDIARYMPSPNYSLPTVPHSNRSGNFHSGYNYPAGLHYDQGNNPDQFYVPQHVGFSFHPPYDAINYPLRPQHARYDNYDYTPSSDLEILGPVQDLERGANPFTRKRRACHNIRDKDGSQAKSVDGSTGNDELHEEDITQNDEEIGIVPPNYEEYYNKYKRKYLRKKEKYNVLKEKYDTLLNQSESNDEIVEGSGVWIKKEKLKDARDASTGKPTVLARNLFRIFFTQEQLGTHCLTGRKCNANKNSEREKLPALDTNIRNAVIVYSTNFYHEIKLQKNADHIKNMTGEAKSLADEKLRSKILNSLSSMLREEYDNRKKAKLSGEENSTNATNVTE